MRKIVLTAAIACTALSLAACSNREDDPAQATGEGAAPGVEAIPTVSEGATAQDTLNANTATIEQMTAAGLPANVAQVVIAGRPYANVVNLSAKLRQTLSAEAAGAALENVFVPVNLNTASEEEIKLIPGMTDKMVHEFLEYRPYENMAEFDREIGKYVDAAEVARFRRYVTL